MEGTNNEQEAFYSFSRSGADPEYVHINDLQRNKKSLENFSMIFIPGGFSAGDYIRGGALFAARLRETSSAELKKFVNEEKPVIGVCNGFQILAELGMLPGFGGEEKRVITLTSNLSNRFECRTTYMKLSSSSRIFNKSFGNGLPHQVPVAHYEGRIVMSGGEKTLQKLIDNDQVLFRYSDSEGNDAGYPWNPNGSPYNIASLTNEAGNVIGLMPHPERVYYPYQMVGKDREKKAGTGELFYDSLVNYIKNN